MIDIDGPKSKDFDKLKKHFHLKKLEQAYWEGFCYMILGLQSFDRGVYQAWEAMDEKTSREKILGSRYLELPAYPDAVATHGPKKNVLVFKSKKLALGMFRCEAAGPHLNHHAGIMHLSLNPERTANYHVSSWSSKGRSH